MSKFIREVSNSISGVAQASTATISGVANVIVSVANTATLTVDGLGATVNSLVKTSNIYTDELRLDALLSASESAIKRGIRLGAMQAISANRDVLDKAQEAVTKAFITELMEDLEF